MGMVKAFDLAKNGNFEDSSNFVLESIISMKSEPVYREE